MLSILQELAPTTPKKTPKPTKSRSRATTPRTKSVKISPVTLGVKGINQGSANSKKGSKMSTSLPLQPRDGAKTISSNHMIENCAKIIGGNELLENGGKLLGDNQLITLHNDNSTLTAQVIIHSFFCSKFTKSIKSKVYQLTTLVKIS